RRVSFRAGGARARRARRAGVRGRAVIASTQLRRPRGGAVAGLATHPLVRLIVRRLLGLAFVAVIAMLAVFLMVQFVPGDPIYQAFGGDLPLQRYHELRHLYHFDQPLLKQFWIYVQNVLHGDLGRSYANQQPVADLIRERAGASAELAGAGLLIVL